jgi:hypothetical protein
MFWLASCIHIPHQWWRQTFRRIGMLTKTARKAARSKKQGARGAEFVYRSSWRARSLDPKQLQRTHYPPASTRKKAPPDFNPSGAHSF